MCLWSVCVIRMDGQTARRILTKISDWIAIYPRGNIGGSLLTQQSSKRSSTWSLTFKLAVNDSPRDQVCLLVDGFPNLAGVFLSPACGCPLYLFRPLAGLPGNANTSSLPDLDHLRPGLHRGVVTYPTIL